ncbi:hypothetical protein DSLASN_20110 [Desulfoluna limicola]|uniref:Uncharacterized protein n=1 Tax=Desulfoluna limicola TaxID=2810562 RepID=A0ABM7PGZ2_9BACT|nr:hypothetical protein [Desulfoluna limicola]BCS96379.1 hypothetical protein DSLASN_20110 [Desulfoluna limicola]
MKHRKAAVISACLLGVALFVVVKVKVNYGVKPNVGVIPRVSAMILYKGSTDDEIIMAMTNNRPIMLETYYESLVVAQRTPLLSALEKERTGIVVYLLNNGVPLRDTVEILRRENLPDYIETLRTIVDQEGLWDAIDCKADCFDINK